MQQVGPLGLLQSWIFWRFPCLQPHGFDEIRWPLAARWGGFLSASDEKAPRIPQLRYRLDMLRESETLIIAAASARTMGIIKAHIR
ncbi:hypothetical protein PIB30_026387 [Stylosanthes scabra]|uniref:Uncharacterized protein n=1 Tax=Stylosanthes scabra TaxID=79078 RepID=A0ABU6RAN1_9FABA|nr:hypothetical protein [Stylosanthes scabra]